MAPKTERIEMRTDADTSALLTEAAETAHVSVTSFVLEAARREADRVLGRRDRTLMPQDQFDRLMEGLDKPDEAPNLAKLAGKPRRFKR